MACDIKWCGLHPCQHQNLASKQAITNQLQIKLRNQSLNSYIFSDSGDLWMYYKKSSESIIDVWERTWSNQLSRTFMNCSQVTQNLHWRDKFHLIVVLKDMIYYHSFFNMFKHLKWQPHWFWTLIQGDPNNLQ
jgi:hypothetical protein